MSWGKRGKYRNEWETMRTSALSKPVVFCTLHLRDDLMLTSTFSVAPAEHRIKIPVLVRNNIAKSKTLTGA